MLHIRRRIYPWLERGALAAGHLRFKEAIRWREAKRLVFVCTGNICRSPYAEFVARQYGLRAISCGIATDPGLPANETAILEARRRERDITSHRTTRWQDVRMEAGDVIVALELKHALVVRPRARKENVPVVLLSSMLPGKFEVLRDPYGRPQSEYARVFDLIEQSVRPIVNEICGQTTLG